MNEVYEEAYKMVKEGAFDFKYLGFEPYGKNVGISGDKVRGYCEEKGIDYYGFLTYMWSRNVEENAE